MDRFSLPDSLLPRATALLLAVAFASILVGPLASPAHAEIIYVDKDAGGANDGSSWADAYTDLQTAINNATSSDEIWVAEGVYVPGSSRGDSFTITGGQNGLEIYGGFDGTESSRSEREPEAHRTILSGDIDGDDTDPDGDGVIEDADPDDDGTAENLNGSNNYRVLFLDGVTGGKITTATVVDGMTVTAGQADGGTGNRHGAGLLCDGGGSGNECSPTLQNMVFAGNYAFTEPRADC